MSRTWLRRTQNSTVPPARFREVNGKYEPFPRVSRFGDYKERNGMMIPIEVEWQLPEGNAPYWGRGRIVDVDYNFAP